MSEVGGSRARRSRSSRFALAAAFAALVATLSGCDTAPVVVSGTVRAEPSGSGVGGVRVTVFADDTETVVAETVTNLSGAYVLQGSSLADGSYRVRVGDQWWPDAASWADAATVELSASSATTIDHSFAEIGSLTGIVVDDRGKALEGVFVVAVRVGDGDAVGGATTDPDGAFGIAVTTADAYRVLLVHPDGAWPVMFVGGGTPTGFDVPGSEVPIGTVDISTGLPHTVPPDGITTRVSVASDGTPVSGHSYEPSISADGRHVAFSSIASNLVADDTNGHEDVFVHDRSTGATSRMSIGLEGAQANDTSRSATLSADGRYITFSSRASNLVAGDTNGVDDVFVHDRSTGVTSRVSLTSAGTQGNGRSELPTISADGRYIAFESTASDLVGGDTNGIADVFVHDRSTAATTRVSVATDGTQGDWVSVAASISGDGTIVAFRSFASNLVAGDTNGLEDVFVHDRSTGATTRVSVASDGAQADEESYELTISVDGRFVAFASYASNLVAGDTNGVFDVFVHDRSTGATTRVSVASDGAEADGSSNEVSISADGRYVAFSSYASNLVGGDTNSEVDVFVHDRSAGATRRVSVATNGTEADSTSYEPSISGDGRVVAFTSGAENLVAGDINRTGDTFVHERQTA